MSKEKKVEKIKENVKKVNNKIKEDSKIYVKSVRKEIGTAILSAFALLIALAWKDVISEFVGTLTALTNTQGSFISALFVTLICVFGILLVKKYISKE
jgi:hypothetical protein